MSAPTLVDVLLAELASDPQALDTLAEHLAPRIADRPPAQQDGWLDTTGAAEYAGLSLPAIHKHTAARTIPFEQDGPGCRCWFKRSELDAWRRGTPRLEARMEASARNTRQQNPAREHRPAP
jgi:hypothetical protein